MLLVLGLWLVHTWQHSQEVPARSGPARENPSVYLKLPPASSATTTASAVAESAPAPAVGASAVLTSAAATAPAASPKSAASSPAAKVAAVADAFPTPAAPSTPERTPVDHKSSPGLPGTTCSVAGWYAQQGAFARLSQATDLSNRLRSANYSVCIGNLSANKWYRVLVGPLPDRQAAAAVAARIQKDRLTRDLGYPQYWSPPQ
ncbi:MAG: SPOR domain-containing protein [Acidithiobacillus sp.]